MIEPTVRVFVYHDSPSVRAEIRTSIKHEMGLEIVGEAALLADAARGVEGTRPDVLIVDVRQAEQGIATCRDMLSRHRDVKCLVLTAFDEEGALLDALLAGAAGYVLERDTQREQLAGTIQAAAAGQSLLEPLLAAVRRGLGELDARSQEILASLSPDDLLVLEAIAEGLRNWEIAERLRRSEPAIRDQVAALLQKLGTRDRGQVLALIASLAGRRAET
jgi:DNA-binding NarL/FixJ family response regulator